MPYLKRNYLAILIGAAAALFAVAVAVGFADLVSDDPEPDRRIAFGSFQFDLDELQEALDEFGEIDDLDDLRRLAQLPQLAVLLELLRSRVGEAIEGSALFSSGQPALGVTIAEDSDRLTVDEVLPGTPASNAGLHPGDEIVRVDGHAVDDIDGLRAAVAAVAPGEGYELEVRRHGELRTLEIEPRAFVAAAIGPLLQGLGQGLGDRLRQQFGGGGTVPRDRAPSPRDVRPSEPQRPSQPRDTRPSQPRERGLPAVPSVPSQAPQLGVSAVDAPQGVRVAEVQPGSGADLAGLRPGDVIVAVSGAPARTIAELRERLSTFRPGDAVPVTVLRDGAREVLRVTLSPPSQRVQAPGAPAPAAPPSGAQSGRFAEATFPPAVLDQLADLVAERLAARAGAAATEPAPPSSDAAPATAAEAEASETPSAPLTAFFGRVATIDGDSITLTGSAGAVTLTLDDETVRIGFKDAEAGDLVTVVVRDGVVQMLIVVG